MVIAELAGGLGNQMFQYAFGSSIAAKNNTELLLDLRFLEIKDQPGDFSYRDYALNNLNCRATCLNPKDYNQADKLIGSIKSKLFRKIAPSRSNYIKEKTSKFHPEYLLASKNVFLRGYWQNPRYFEDISDKLIQEFQFSPSSNQSVLDIKKKITRSDNPVAVHVRRGDYKFLPGYLAACTPEYYSKAFKFFKNEVVNEDYFIFSNDPQWVRDNLVLPPNTLIIEHKSPVNDYEDMYLMTLCNHHIIANSSYSWWGAWLAQSSGQIVIAPKTWDGIRRSEDIVDKDWRLL